MLILCTLDLSSPMQSTISIPLYLRVSSASFLAQFSPNEVLHLGGVPGINHVYPFISLFTFPTCIADLKASFSSRDSYI